MSTPSCRKRLWFLPVLVLATLGFARPDAAREETHILADFEQGGLGSRWTAHGLIKVAREALPADDETRPSLQSFRLRKGVAGVAFDPTGSLAMILHNKVAGTPSPTDNVEAYVDKSHGYTLFDPSSGFAKLELAPSLAGGVAFSADGQHAFVLFRDDERSVRRVHRVELGDVSALRAEELGLGSPPTTIGLIERSGQAFVAQEHSEGRITFVGVADGAQRTVTGFELNDRIEQEER